jgi:hypothetical protein
MSMAVIEHQHSNPTHLEYDGLLTMTLQFSEVRGTSETKKDASYDKRPSSIRHGMYCRTKTTKKEAEAVTLQRSLHQQGRHIQIKTITHIKRAGVVH